MKRITKLLALVMCMAFVITAFTPSTAFAAGTVGQAKLKSVKVDKNYQVVVTWEKVKGATGYVVYRKNNEWANWQKVGTTTKTTFKDVSWLNVISNTAFDIGADENIHYKVRAYVKNGKKTTYGKYSKAKSVKATRYYYNNKLTYIYDWENDSNLILKAELPKDFKTSTAPYYGNGEIGETIDDITQKIGEEFKQTKEGAALAAEYDELVAKADDLFNKMCDSESEEDYNKYSIEYTEANNAYCEVWDKLNAKADDFSNLVTKSADAYYNNVKDSKGNTLTTLDDVNRVIKAEDTSDYSGWFISMYGGANELEPVAQTPNGTGVYYITDDVTYSLSVLLEAPSTGKNIIKEKGAKFSTNSTLGLVGFTLMKYENGHRVKATDIDLSEVDDIIENIKFTPVALTKAD